MIRWLALLTILSAAFPALSKECAPIEGIEPLLQRGRILVLGEIHGTVESPAFALDVACHAASAGLPLVVGLEQRPTEQGNVDRFLASAGTAEDRRQLLSGATWQASYQDGRTSWAMFDLIEGLRFLRSDGATVRVVLFDASGAGGGQQRERAMARNLAAAVDKSPRAMTIILTGNRHSRITRGGHRSSEYEPMAYLLRRAVPPDNLLSLDVGHGGGSAWICAPDCGVTKLAGHQGESSWVIEIDDSTRPAGHHGWYHVGRLTASVPARMDRGSAPSERSEPPPSDRASSEVPEPRHENRAARTENAEAVRPLSAEESKLQGSWQAYDFATRSKIWKFHFDGRRFRADGGSDDWYEGRIAIRPDAKPAQIDFAIEDCRCSYKGMTSEGIFYWNEESLVIAAPQPGKLRPHRFVKSSGQMMELVRPDGS